MPRTMRVEYPGAIYHVMIRLRWGSDAMNRGDLPSSDCGKASLPSSDYGKASLPSSDYGKASLPSSDYGKASQREDIFVEEEDGQELKPLRRGWCLGSEEFRQQMLEVMEGKLGENHSGQLHRETAEQKGKRVIAEELARLGWQESDLASRRKGHPEKLAIALRLRMKTPLSSKWIAARVRIGSFKRAKSVLHRTSPDGFSIAGNDRYS